METIPLPDTLAPDATCLDTHSQQPCTLALHLPPLPFWGLATPIYNERRDSDVLMDHMQRYHPLALRWLQCTRDYMDQEPAYGKSFLTTCRVVSQVYGVELKELYKEESPYIPNYCLCPRQGQVPYGQLTDSR